MQTHIDPRPLLINEPASDSLPPRDDLLERMEDLEATNNCILSSNTTGSSFGLSGGRVAHRILDNCMLVHGSARSSNSQSFLFERRAASKSCGAKIQAFTLLELLVVIAVIALLAAILLPTLDRAKQSAHLAKCASNLRQIGLAAALYVTDHSTYPFDWTNAGGSYLGDAWSDRLSPYLSALSSGGVFRCPGTPDRFKYGDGGFVWYGERDSWGAASKNGTTSSYGVNSQGTDLNTPRGIDGNWPEYPSPLPDVIPPVKEIDIIAPSDMIAFGDTVLLARIRMNEGPGYVVFPSELEGHFDFPQYQFYPVTPPERAIGLSAEAQRHRGLFNVSFCDAHVESLRAEKLFGVAPDLTARWNRDHQTHTDAWEF